MIAKTALLAVSVLAGDWRIDDGALEALAPQGGPRRALAAALVGPEAALDGVRLEVLEATVQGRNAFFLFDVERDDAGRIARARFAGLYLGGGRAVIGEIARAGGAPRVLAEAPCDVRAGRPYALRLALDGARAALAVEGAEVLAHAFDARRGAGQGLLTFAAARFDDVVARAGGQVVFEERFDDRTDGPVGAAGGGGEMMGPAGGASGTGAGASAGTSAGGYPGGTFGKLPGLDAPLGEESFALDPLVRRAIRRTYLDLIGRGPTEAEVLAAAGKPRAALVDALLASEDFWRNWYEDELYHFLLIDQFRPAADPLASLPARLARAETDPRAALAEIVISQYFSARNPGNDTFVTVVMEQVLGLRVQEPKNVSALEAGKRMYDGIAVSFLGERGASQADLVRIAFGKRAFAERYIERLHRRIVGTEIAPAVLAPAADRFAAEPRALTKIVREWVLAPEYEARPPARAKTDAQWIRTLWADLLGARPDYKEFRDTRNALLALADSMPIRLVLGKVVIDSKQADRVATVRGESERWVKERFLLLLGRPANREEVAACLELLERYGSRAVLRGIVASQEYQRY